MTYLRALAHSLDPVLWAHDALGFDAEPFQVDVLRSMAPRVALNCTRQAGKSTCSALITLHTAIHRPGSLSLIIAPALRQSNELRIKVDGFLSQLSPRPQVAEENAQTLALSNGSRIVCTPSTDQSRGFSAPTLIVLDEASRISEESIAAVRPMLASSKNGRLLMLSTPNGQRGAFFQAFTEHADDWELHTVSASEIPRISAAFLEAERRALGPRTFAQEYEAQFCETDAALFDIVQLNACVSNDVKPLFGDQGTLGARHLQHVLSNNVVPLFPGR